MASAHEIRSTSISRSNNFFPRTMTVTAMFPLEHVYYRIQSVDLANYLELYDVNREKVVMRPMKECLEQQWVFVTDGSSGYTIQNAATESLRNSRYLSVDLNDPTTPNAIAVTKEDEPKVWSLRPTSHQNTYLITSASERRGHEILLLVDDDGKTGFAEVERSNDDNFPQSKRWKILVDSPSVPKDTYRIRTLNGAVLQMQSQNNVVFLQAWANTSDQEWDVESFGNGRCTIKSTSEVAYLGYETSKDGFAKVFTTASPLYWNVEKISEYAYTINTKLSMPEQSCIIFSLTSRGNNEIIMKPKKVTQNSIWLFETVYVKSEQSRPNNAAPAPPADIFSPDPYISNGSYNLRNIGTGQYMSVVTSPYWRYSPGAKTYKFAVCYTGNGGEFTLAFSTLFLERAGGLVIAGSSTMYKWVLERFDDPSGGHYYHICVADDRNSILSGDTRRDINSKPMYTIVQKRAGYANHLWKFETS